MKTETSLAILILGLEPQRKMVINIFEILRGRLAGGSGDPVPPPPSWGSRGEAPEIEIFLNEAPFGAIPGYFVSQHAAVMCNHNFCP
jgi:hypothetical protein